MGYLVIFLIVIVILLSIGTFNKSYSNKNSKKEELISEKEKLIDNLRIDRNFIGGAVYFGFNKKNHEEESKIDRQINQLKEEIRLLKM